VVVRALARLAYTCSAPDRPRACCDAQCVSDPDNQEAGLKALQDLRAVAKDFGVIEDEQARKTDLAAQKRAREERQSAIAARERGLGELHAKYMELALNPDGAQQRGYDLQDLLAGLFKLHDILYQPPYRKGSVEETDGFFTFRGFDYLLEARWRKTQPPIADLRAFSGKVKAKIVAVAHHHGDASGEEGADQRGPRFAIMAPVAVPRELPICRGKCFDVHDSRPLVSGMDSSAFFV
jgi:hypothetical protein